MNINRVPSLAALSLVASIHVSCNKRLPEPQASNLRIRINPSQEEARRLIGRLTGASVSSIAFGARVPLTNPSPFYPIPKLQEIVGALTVFAASPPDETDLVRRVLHLEEEIGHLRRAQELQETHVTNLQSTTNYLTLLSILAGLLLTFLMFPHRIAQMYLLAKEQGALMPNHPLVKTINRIFRLGGIDFNGTHPGKSESGAGLRSD